MCLVSILHESVAISNELAISIIALFLGVFSLNRKLIVPFIFLFLLGVFFLEIIPINFTWMIFSIFLGFFSHLILDSFTPAGVKIFSPIFSKKFHKSFGIAMLFLLGIIAIPLVIPRFIQTFTLF